MSKKDLGSIAGLPDELGVGEDLARSEQQLRIRTETRTYGKAMTIVEGFDNSIDVKELASELKSALATGGTVSDGHIELQGDHRDRLPDILQEHGFRVQG